MLLEACLTPYKKPHFSTWPLNYLLSFVLTTIKRKLETRRVRNRQIPTDCEAEVGLLLVSIFMSNRLILYSFIA